MKTIYNNIIPFKGFVALTFYPFVFVRNDRRQAYDNPQSRRHEEIHGEQQKEMLFVFFYLWYLIEWVIKLIYFGNRKAAYRNIGFEREAYCNASDASYIDSRKHFAWFKYIRV